MQTERIQQLTTQLYGNEEGGQTARRIETLTAEYKKRVPRRQMRDLTEKDSILIAYPDQIKAPGLSPLSVVADFADRYLQALISCFHLLPFYPWSSDDGFSVMDFRAVAAQYGTWDDVARLGKSFDLLLDAEVNHASAQGEWFHLFLSGQEPYRDYFIRIEGSPDLSAVSRPRTTPLITHFESSGPGTPVWTTFGPDQADLNYRSPALLLEMIDVLLFYVTHGAAFIRLDAAAFLWKDVGTTCVNLPQTHLIVQIFRAVLEQIAPYVRLITETNMPQADTISYFGDGQDEANLIYNFALPPLMLHAFQTEHAAILGQWISSLRLPSEQTTFLNVLATHDGIGLNPLRGILPEGEIQEMTRQCIAHGGLVSSKLNPDGTLSPYELNMNYLDALDALGPDVDRGLQVERFITAHAVMLSLRGVPAVYFHSLFGSRGWPEGVVMTGRKRSINREKLWRDHLEAELGDPGSLRAQVYQRLGRLLGVRAQHGALSPSARQRLVGSQGSILALVREMSATAPQLLCLYNLSPERRDFRVDDLALDSALPANPRDLITGRRLRRGVARDFGLEPYESLWLALDNQE